MAGADNAALAAAAGVSEAEIVAFRKKKRDDADIAQAIADHLGVTLPEIDVIDFRRSGYLPEALSNFLALQGWSPGDDREVMTRDEMVAAFSVSRIGKAKAQFDRKKLRWMNAIYLRAATPERLLEAARDYAGHNPESPLGGLDDARLGGLLGLYQQRIETLGELETQAGWFFAAPSEYGPAKAVKRHLLKGGGLEHLAAARGALAACGDWSAQGIEAAAQALADARADGRMGKIAQPLRIAITGGPVSPGLGDTVSALAKGEVLARIDACLAHHGA